MKHLKTFLYFEGNTVANETVLYAAQMNAGSKDNSLGLAGLWVFAHSLKDVGRFEDTQVEKIGETTLHIDAKINGEWENVLCVEEVEIFETVNQLEETETETGNFVLIHRDSREVYNAYKTWKEAEKNRLTFPKHYEWTIEESHSIYED